MFNAKQRAIDYLNRKEEFNVKGNSGKEEARNGGAGKSDEGADDEPNADE